MKVFQIFIGVLILVLAFSFSVVAQRNQIIAQEVAYKNKVAIVDSALFRDAAKGIKLLIKANRAADRYEYFRSMHLIMDIKEVGSEIDKLIAQNQPINEKYLELQRLSNELKESGEDEKNYYNNVQSTLITPVNEKIQKKLLEFSELKGYVVVVNKSKTALLIDNGVVDITLEFIQFCNDSFDKDEITVNN